MSFKEELQTIKDKITKKYAIFYNDGSVSYVSEDDIYHAQIWSRDHFNEVTKELGDVYGHYYERTIESTGFDMNLKMGVLFNAKDVTEDQTLKEGAKVASNLVHYYPMKITEYDGEEELEQDWFMQYGLHRGHDYIEYSEFVKKAQEEGFNFSGPDTLKELAKQVSTKEPFKMNITYGTAVKEEKVTKPRILKLNIRKK